MFSLLLLAAQLQLASQPTATIGAVDGDTTQTLSNVVSVVLDDRDNVYVFQRMVPYVAVFDGRGRRIATLGRSGGGPGEFALPTRISFSADSIWIADASLGKLTQFAPDFSHVRDLVLGHAFPDLLKRPARLVPLAATSHGVLIEARVGEDVITLHQPWTGSSPREVSRLRRDDVTRILQVAGRTVTIVRPVLEHPFVVSIGDRYALVERSEKVSLAFHNQAGGVASAIDVPVRRAKVTDAYLQSAIDQQVEALKNIAPSSSRGTLRRSLEDAMDPPPESYFIEGALVCASCGTVWLRQAVPERPATLVEVDVTTGRVGRTVSERPGEKVMATGDGYVWVLRLDDDDVPFLHRIELR